MSYKITIAEIDDDNGEEEILREEECNGFHVILDMGDRIAAGANGIRIGDIVTEMVNDEDLYKCASLAMVFKVFGLKNNGEDDIEELLGEAGIG